MPPISCRDLVEYPKTQVNPRYPFATVAIGPAYRMLWGCRHAGFPGAESALGRRAQTLDDDVAQRRRIDAELIVIVDRRGRTVRLDPVPRPIDAHPRRARAGRLEVMRRRVVIHVAPFKAP